MDEVVLDGDVWEVPANCSRYFVDRTVALNQPLARLDYVWNAQGHYLYNRSFDGSLIKHDAAYYSGVVDIAGVDQVPTLSYFDKVAARFNEGFHTVDIGCGQGEFVNALLARGFSAVGYDPVLRTSAEHLVGRYWVPGETSANLYVMRCVLPHIPEPWNFLRAIAESDPGARVLLEFQSLDWIADKGVWYQLSHDHVNLFRPQDFFARFDVIDSGEFSNGEWAWVLIDPHEFPTSPPTEFERPDAIRNLRIARTELLRAASIRDQPLVIWGAAGKGQVLCHALVQSGFTEVVAADADQRRWGQFLEVSGVEVVEPTVVRDELVDRQVLVANPTHLDSVNTYLNEGDARNACAVTPAQFAREVLAE